MPGPKPVAISLTAAEQQELERLVRGLHTPQQLAVRARLILAAAAGDTNRLIARTLHLTEDTVRLWRGRWAAAAPAPVAARLTDAPRAGAPPRFTPEQVCRIIALACAAPRTAGRPISQWTGHEIADEVVARGIVTVISPRHAARLLKKGSSNPIASATG
jgi:putative transposase